MAPPTRTAGKRALCAAGGLAGMKLFPADLDVTDAKVAFKTGSSPFLIFRNVENNQVGVIYRRDNGELGHMESSS